MLPSAAPIAAAARWEWQSPRRAFSTGTWSLAAPVSAMPGSAGSGDRARWSSTSAAASGFGRAPQRSHLDPRDVLGGQRTLRFVRRLARRGDYSGSPRVVDRQRRRETPGSPAASGWGPFASGRRSVPRGRLGRSPRLPGVRSSLASGRQHRPCCQTILAARPTISPGPTRCRLGPCCEMAKGTTHTQQKKTGSTPP